jgi:transcription elongation factor Elf1
MQPSGPPEISGARATNDDIVFACQHCSTSSVVEAAAAGLTVSCQMCGQPTLVPKLPAEGTSGEAVRVSELQHRLKENESQRTEITSYINQHSIQLYRWQLRLKDLKERQRTLEAELAAISQSLA